MWPGLSIEISLVIILACADIIQRPGWRQVLMYNCTENAKQLMCTAQLVQTSVSCLSFEIEGENKI